MHASPRIGWVLGIGVVLMLLALILQTITLVNHDYRTVLILALVLTVAADFCFVGAFLRGSFALRCIAVLLMLPTAFVIIDFLRRAPHSFS